MRARFTEEDATAQTEADQTEGDTYLYLLKVDHQTDFPHVLQFMFIKICTASSFFP